MINSFRHKLRMAALEDQLCHDLGLRPETAAWIGRMAWDVAAEQHCNLMAYRGDALLLQFVRVLDKSPYTDLLARAASDNQRFGNFLANAREQLASDTAQAA